MAKSCVDGGAHDCFLHESLRLGRLKAELEAPLIGETRKKHAVWQNLTRGKDRSERVVDGAELGMFLCVKPHRATARLGNEYTIHPQLLEARLIEPEASSGVVNFQEEQ